MTSSDVPDCVNKLLSDKNDLINKFSQIISTSKEAQKTAEKECQDLQKQINEALQVEADLHSKLKVNISRQEELKTKLSKYKNEIEVLQSKCKDLVNSTEVKDSDNARLENAKEILNIGKEFTGIRWDYSAPQNIVQGYIANKHKNTLEPFEINKENMSEDKIQIELWNKIQATSSVDWSDLIAKNDPDKRITNKENITQN